MRVRFGRVLGEYCRLRERSRGVPDPEDVIDGLKELRAAVPGSQDQGRAERGDPPRPRAEREADWAITGTVSGQAPH
jgi:hypothetical protein